MNQNPYALEDLFIRLQGTQIVDYSYGQQVLRLQIKTPVASQLLANTDTLHLVLRDCTKLFYLSYTQTLEERIAQNDPEYFFGIGLQIQGLQLRNRETADKINNQDFIIFCNSYLHNIEAGELHFKAGGFQLYDQEFGQINFEDFKRAAGELQADH
ncbi:hypothetical protein AAE02nite_45690 [Adhaeribacter aerolatus]|uniref:Uncharacterized protein n=1 Tax=Adhaeribacter aerolatus TaxID=670289 RepID=A0A512B4K3_9BACT|nr:hypothetical protein [Adhaeribacter aerolatus]GEO06905.1 hypothetical protein AAE02nite_45690 [Adhaeribacter aerolatus]